MLTKIVKIAVCLCAAFAMVGVSAGNDNINDESPLETEGDEEMSLIVIENYNSKWNDIGTFDLPSNDIVLIVEGEEPIDEEEIVEEEIIEEETTVEEETIEEEITEEEIIEEKKTVVAENATSESTMGENTTGESAKTETAAKVEIVVKTETVAEPEPEPEPELETNSVNTFSDSDKSLLLRIGMAEAGGESLNCVASVMRVVLNRVDSNEFPNNIHDVIYQSGQFVPVSSRSFESVAPNEKCYEAYDMIVSGWDETNGALYFESCSGSSWHSRNLTLLFTIGNMRFYK